MRKWYIYLLLSAVFFTMVLGFQYLDGNGIDWTLPIGSTMVFTLLVFIFRSFNKSKQNKETEKAKSTKFKKILTAILALVAGFVTYFVLTALTYKAEGVFVNVGLFIISCAFVVTTLWSSYENRQNK